MIVAMTQAVTASGVSFLGLLSPGFDMLLPVGRFARLP
jgi:hypothetical protein